MNEQVFKKLLLSYGIFEKWHGKTLDDYTGSSVKIKEFLSEYIEGGNKSGLLFTGINGIGKTMLMNVVLMNFARQGHKVHVVPYWNLVSEYTKSWRGESKYQDMLKAPFLGINDFGKSFEATENSKELAKSAVEFLIDYRIQREKPLFLTTNIPLNGFRKLYSDDIASKLNEACILLEFSEKDKFSDDKRISKSKIIKG